MGPFVEAEGRRVLEPLEELRAEPRELSGVQAQAVYEDALDERLEPRIGIAVGALHSERQ